LGSIGLGDDGGEAAIGKQGVGRPTHMNWIAGRGIRKRPPLRCPEEKTWPFLTHTIRKPSDETVYITYLDENCNESYPNERMK
jgi:hypothetical protein